MLRRAFLIDGGRAVVGLALMPQAAARAKRLPDLVPELEKQIPAVMAETRVPGLSIAVIHDGTLGWRRGFGVRDTATGAAVDADTVFAAGSMSKPVFAYAVLKLCERGVLELDAPLTKYTSERFLDGDPRLDRMTARHVLSHTGGFQNWRSSESPLKIHFTPGERYRYSGEGYNYLQSVVTRLTGKTDRTVCARYEGGVEICGTDIDRLLTANVLVPFGMTSSGYRWSDTFERHAARPHDAEGKPLDHRPPTAPDLGRYAAAGALLTTPSDYARFVLEVIAPKESDTYRLKRKTLAEMLRPHVKLAEPYPSSWALGWQIFHSDKGDVIGHGGDNPGAHAFAVASVDAKSGYVIMTNGDGGVAALKRLMPIINPYLQA